MTSDISSKFNKLKELSVEFSDNDKKTISSWEVQFRDSRLIADLSDHDGMKMFIEMLEKQVKDIDSVLCGKRDLTEEDRRDFWRIKDINNKIINFFAVAKSNKIRIEKKVNEEIEFQELT